MAKCTNFRFIFMQVAQDNKVFWRFLAGMWLFAKFHRSFNEIDGASRGAFKGDLRVFRADFRVFYFFR